jgi:hypothetical protein
MLQVLIISLLQTQVQLTFLLQMELLQVATLSLQKLTQVLLMPLENGITTAQQTR